MTKAYLLTWNPARWEWINLQQIASTVAAGKPIVERWSTGHNRNIQPGDRLFLLRQGADRPGLVASGWAISTVFQALHWEAARAARGDIGNFVEFEIDTLLDPAADDLLPRDMLLEDPDLVAVHWNTRASGIRINPQVLPHLEARWQELTGSGGMLSQELPRPFTLPEGAQRSVTVNAYERSHQARRQCLAHYGPVCVVCSFESTAVYGPDHPGIIEVHHLMPLADISAAYQVDPIADLRPVCPNCHALIHSRRPPYTIAEARRFIR
jgi:5-methylcytosine-specific restriction protein A